MDALTVIATALAAGAGAGAQQVASSTVTDLYAQLKRLLGKSLGQAVDATTAPVADITNLLEPHAASLEADQHIRNVAEALLASLAAEGILPESPTFKVTIRRTMEEFGKRVEELTAEQYRVITLLRLEPQVLISGAAGSGKTLVAAEKAMRLADSGMHVLFLCHNPLLAQHVRRLIAGSPVEVQDFNSWVRSKVGEWKDGTEVWTPYHEPVESEVLVALDRVLVEPKYDAVIVDEGQDFREE